MFKSLLSCLLALWGSSALYAEAPLPGSQGHYFVLSCKTSTPPPVAVVDLLMGPTESVEGKTAVWWQLESWAKNEPGEPLFQLQVLTSRDPLTPSKEPLRFYRYILRIPETGEVLEYRTVQTKQALLPAWSDFVENFFPHAEQHAAFDQGFTKTCTYLGHILALHQVKPNIAWTPLKPTKTLDLDPELLIGTSRSFKDKEGHRLPQTPQPQNYTYVPFDEADYKLMIETGINIYTVSDQQEKFVRSEPVFYIRQGSEKRPRFPADLYRSNFVGSPMMFMDEPASIMTGEMTVMRFVRTSIDCAAALTRRVRENYYSKEEVYGLEHDLKQGGVNFGEMRLGQIDMPIWETLYDTSFYQMSAGGNGIIFEARFQLDEFDKMVAERAGVQRKHTVEEMLRYHYAFLRGGARPFGKFWGTSIYGQCDPKISPDAFNLAYDMGARYFWFWTSDHDHHMPWPEQLELTKSLRKHVADHPRPSIFAPLPTRDLAIVIPYGAFPSVYSGFDIGDRTMLKKLQPVITEAFDKKEDFDITVDDGREIIGYKRIVRVKAE